MKTRIYFKGILFSLLIFTVSFSFRALAAQSLKAPVQDRDMVNRNEDAPVNYTDEVLLEASSRTDAKCQVLNGRINNHVSQYESNKQGHLIAFKNMQERLQRLSTFLSDKGYDVAELNDQISVLDVMISDFQSDMALYIEKLKDSRNYACGESQGAYKEAVANSREQLRIVRQDVVDIRAQYQNNIRPILTALRNQAQVKVRERALLKEQIDVKISQSTISSETEE